MDLHIHFQCTDRRLPGEQWEGWIEPLGSLKPTVTQLQIHSRSGFFAIVGDTNFGHFICLPDLSIGSYLADYTDLFWNKERLVELIGLVDGITVACALKAAHRVGLI